MATKAEAEVVVRSLAGFYGLELDEQFQLPLYTKCLEPYPVALLQEAMNKYVQDTRNDRFPVPPNKIVETITGSAKDDDMIGNEVATRIRSAISKFGCALYDTPERTAEIAARVRAFVGEVGWKIIEREGGWTRFCVRENTSGSDSRIAQAQLRDMAKSVLAQSRAGILDKAPALPLPSDAKKLQLELSGRTAGKTEALRQLAAQATKPMPATNSPQEWAQNGTRQASDKELPLDQRRGAETGEGEPDRREK